MRNEVKLYRLRAGRTVDLETGLRSASPSLISHLKFHHPQLMKSSKLLQWRRQRLPTPHNKDFSGAQSCTATGFTESKPDSLVNQAANVTGGKLIYSQMSAHWAKQDQLWRGRLIHELMLVDERVWRRACVQKGPPDAGSGKCMATWRWRGMAAPLGRFFPQPASSRKHELGKFEGSSALSAFERDEVDV